ncbi:MAG: hypothetical protein ACFFG0_01595 [Candidatus Thorarchaeota archaeon]
MPLTIDNEAKRQLRSPLDIEGFGRRYKTLNGYYSFPDPNLETVDKNLFYLLRNSQEVKFESKYKYRPDYLSYDYYGTTLLWDLIMYINGVFSLEDFDLETVIIPSLQSITDILPDRFSIPDADDLEEIEW